MDYIRLTADVQRDEDTSQNACRKTGEARLLGLYPTSRLKLRRCFIISMASFMMRGRLVWILARTSVLSKSIPWSVRIPLMLHSSVSDVLRNSSGHAMARFAYMHLTTGAYLRQIFVLGVVYSSRI